MIRIGIRAHDVGKASIDVLANSIKEKGFSNIQLVLNKAIIDDDGFLDITKAEKYHQVFKNKGINISMMGAYFNPIHSNQEVVKKGIQKFENHLTFAPLLDCNLVGTETGSLNDDKWTFHKDNASEESYQKVLKVFKHLVDFASSTKSNVAIEGAYGHVINTPKRLKRLIDELNSDKTKVIIDLYNYLSIDNYQDYQTIFQEAVDLLQDKIVIYHFKDFIVQDNTLIQVGLGQGIIDYQFIIKTIINKTPDATVIFEGVTKDNIKTSLENIKEIIKLEMNEYECQ